MFELIERPKTEEQPHNSLIPVYRHLSLDCNCCGLIIGGRATSVCMGTIFLGAQEQLGQHAKLITFRCQEGFCTKLCILAMNYPYCHKLNNI